MSPLQQFPGIRLCRAIVAPVNEGRAFFWFGLALAATLGLSHQGYDTSEGLAHLRTALFWLETGDLGQPRRPGAIFLQAPDGLYYPAHELGNILWLLPAAAAGLAAEALAGGHAVLDGADARRAEVVASFMSPLTVAATALGFWKLLEWSFAVPVRVRLAASALLVFATMLLPYSRSLSDVVATGCWITWGAAFAARATARGRAEDAALSGFFLGCAFLTRLPAGVAILPVVIAMIARATPERRAALAAAAVAAALPSLAAVLWFNDVRTGSPFVPGLLHPQYTITQPGSGSLAAGAAGLLFSPGKSIFLFSPALLIAALGMPRMLRDARTDALMVLGVLALFVGVHGSLLSWHGDWGWGPRYAVFVLPLLLLPAVFVLNAGEATGARRHAMRGIVAAGVVVQLAAVAINWQYQYQLMSADGRLHASTPWRADNQLTDGLRAAAGNAARTAGAGMPARVPAGVSRHTRTASTGVNVWWITAVRAGVLPAYALAAAAALFAIAAFAWRRALELSAPR
ncbi:MAG TPA: hypothetical protein VMN81_03750 [Vicinamibacterales bacterium]|nr:hypothetical protein [Vicinamibacterales bacterium]